MSRQPRNELPDGTFHVTAHSVFGLELFVDDQDRYVFLWLLGELTERFAIRSLAYCLMDTHYHLLLEGSTADLGAAMHRLNGRYARAFNERHHRGGHVFAERYAARVIVDDLHLEQAYEYIEANPGEGRSLRRRRALALDLDREPRPRGRPSWARACSSGGVAARTAVTGLSLSLPLEPAGSRSLSATASRRLPRHQTVPQLAEQ